MLGVAGAASTGVAVAVGVAVAGVGVAAVAATAASAAAAAADLCPCCAHAMLTWPVDQSGRRHRTLQLLGRRGERVAHGTAAHTLARVELAWTLDTTEEKREEGEMQLNITSYINQFFC